MSPSGELDYKKRVHGKEKKRKEKGGWGI